MTRIYLVSRRNTGAALFGNWRMIPTLYRNFAKAKERLECELSNVKDEAERSNWYIKKFELDGEVAGKVVFAVFSQRLGRGSYRGRPWMIGAFATMKQADEYIKTNSPRSILGKFFAEYELTAKEVALE
jgi:hypothetical protein